MIIRFISTLTADHENLIAPMVLRVVGSILDLLPIAYRIRIDTVDARVYQQVGPTSPDLQIRLADQALGLPSAERFES